MKIDVLNKAIDKIAEIKGMNLQGFHSCRPEIWNVLVEVYDEASRGSRSLSAVPSELQKIKRIVDIVETVSYWQCPEDNNLVSVNLKKLEMELMERGIAG